MPTVVVVSWMVTSTRPRVTVNTRKFVRVLCAPLRAPGSSYG